MAEASKSKRATSKRLFTRTEKAICQALETRALDETIQRRFDEFSRQWAKVQECHDEYIENLPDYSEEDILVEDEWLDELSERFYKIELEVDRELHDRKEATREELKLITQDIEQKMMIEKVQTEKVSTSVKSNSVQLERMKFEPFNGEIRKYPQFKTEFQAYIKPLCMPAQLPFILRSYLKNEVKEEVENVEDNYEALWERLDAKYGDRGQLIDCIMAEVKNLGECQNCNDEDTLELIKTVEKAHRDLIRIREGDQMNNATIISLIEQKLPEKILEEWIKEVSTNDYEHRNRFDKLMNLLGVWRKRIEYRIATIRAKPKQMTGDSYHSDGGTKKRYDKAAGGKSQGKNERCWIHASAGDHPIWRCRVYQELPVEERVRLAESNNACKLCLIVGHKVEECRRGFYKCPETGCNGKHNRLLHTKVVQVSSSHVADTNDVDSAPTILPTQEL